MTAKPALLAALLSLCYASAAAVPDTDTAASAMVTDTDTPQLRFIYIDGGSAYSVPPVPDTAVPLPADWAAALCGELVWDGEEVNSAVIIVNNGSGDAALEVYTRGTNENSGEKLVRAAIELGRARGTRLRFLPAKQTPPHITQLLQQFFDEGLEALYIYGDNFDADFADAYRAAFDAVRGSDGSYGGRDNPFGGKNYLLFDITGPKNADNTQKFIFLTEKLLIAAIIIAFSIILLLGLLLLGRRRRSEPRTRVSSP
jgi:hypothetical protein